MRAGIELIILSKCLKIIQLWDEPPKKKDWIRENEGEKKKKMRRFS